jgi:hypothetical protein
MRRTRRQNLVAARLQFSKERPQRLAKRTSPISRRFFPGPSQRRRAARVQPQRNLHQSLSQGIKLKGGLGLAFM